jgi:hypothetical protein
MARSAHTRSERERQARRQLKRQRKEARRKDKKKGEVAFAFGETGKPGIR